MVDALNETFGRAAFDCLSMGGASDEELLQLLAKLGKENGEFHAALADGLSDRLFSRERMDALRREALDVVSALMTLLRRLETYVDEGPR